VFYCYSTSPVIRGIQPVTESAHGSFLGVYPNFIDKRDSKVTENGVVVCVYVTQGEVPLGHC